MGDIQTDNIPKKTSNEDRIKGISDDVIKVISMGVRERHRSAELRAARRHFTLYAVCLSILIGFMIFDYVRFKYATHEEKEQKYVAIRFICIPKSHVFHDNTTLSFFSKFNTTSNAEALVKVISASVNGKLALNKTDEE